MADKLVRLAEDMSVIRRFVDMGDGTFAASAASINVGSATGGLLLARVIAAGSLNPTSVKATPSTLYGVEACNNAAYAVFLKFYDKPTAPTVGTDTPVWTIQIPAGGRCEINRPQGVKFAIGLAYGISKGYADSDVTAVLQADLVGSLNYT